MSSRTLCVASLFNTRPMEMCLLSIYPHSSFVHSLFFSPPAPELVAKVRVTSICAIFRLLDVFPLHGCLPPRFSISVLHLSHSSNAVRVYFKTARCPMENLISTAPFFSLASWSQGGATLGDPSIPLFPLRPDPRDFLVITQGFAFPAGNNLAPSPIVLMLSKIPSSTVEQMGGGDTISLDSISRFTSKGVDHTVFASATCECREGRCLRDAANLKT